MQKRYLFVMIDLFLCLIGFIINISPAPSGVRYFGLFLVVSGSYAGLPSVVAWLGARFFCYTGNGLR
jgi:hypothetical protein